MRDQTEAGRSRGFFVALEGIDGAGKSTALAAAGPILSAAGHPVAHFDKKDLDFGSPYVRRHLGELRRLLWDHPADDPYLQLGDFHWVHLQAAWYSALATCRVEPLLAAGYVVITDTWVGKFLAKLRSRPAVDVAAAEAAFARLPQPDLVVRLDVDPTLAASRKASFSISESGNDESVLAPSVEAFVAYQARLATVLDDMARERGWTTIDCSALSVRQTGFALASAIQHALDVAPDLVPARRHDAGRG